MDPATLADQGDRPVGVFVQHQVARVERDELAAGDLGLVAEPVEAERARQPADDGHPSGELPEDAGGADAPLYRGSPFVVSGLDFGGACKAHAAVGLVDRAVAEIRTKCSVLESIEWGARTVRGRHLLPARPVHPTTTCLLRHGIGDAAERLLVEGDRLGENRVPY